MDERQNMLFQAMVYDFIFEVHRLKINNQERSEIDCILEERKDQSPLIKKQCHQMASKIFFAKIPRMPHHQKKLKL